jgi:hypothetical protein
MRQGNGMQYQKLPCPIVGHKTFEQSIRNITIGDTESPQQISKFIRPKFCLTDEIGLQYEPGELQKSDIQRALTMFAYSDFIKRVINQNLQLFYVSQCRIYQFQTIKKQSGLAFIFGLFITDGSNNLIDFCTESKNVERRKGVIKTLMRAICTPESVNRKLNH